VFPFDHETSERDAIPRHMQLARCNKVRAIWDIRVITVRMVSHCGLNARLGVVWCAANGAPENVSNIMYDTLTPFLTGLNA